MYDNLTEQHMQHAMGVLQRYVTLYGASGSEQAQRAASLSIGSALGSGWPMGQDYVMVKHDDEARDEPAPWVELLGGGMFKVVRENPLGLEVGAEYGLIPSEDARSIYSPTANGAEVNMPDFGSRTVSELRVYADDYGVELHPKASKKAIIEELESYLRSLGSKEPKEV